MSEYPKCEDCDFICDNMYVGKHICYEYKTKQKLKYIHKHQCVTLWYEHKLKNCGCTYICAICQCVIRDATRIWV